MKCLLSLIIGAALFGGRSNNYELKAIPGYTYLTIAQWHLPVHTKKRRIKKYVILPQNKKTAL
jgi:hypothetical protein